LPFGAEFGRRPDDPFSHAERSIAEAMYSDEEAALYDVLNAWAER
jgi:hypothetical protein